MTPVPILALRNLQATIRPALRNTIAPETVDTRVVVGRRTGELLLVAAEPSATNAPVHDDDQISRPSHDKPASSFMVDWWRSAPGWAPFRAGGDPFEREGDIAKRSRK